MSLSTAAVLNQVNFFSSKVEEKKQQGVKCPGLNLYTYEWFRLLNRMLREGRGEEVTSMTEVIDGELKQLPLKEVVTYRGLTMDSWKKSETRQGSQVFNQDPGYVSSSTSIEEATLFASMRASKEGDGAFPIIVKMVGSARDISHVSDSPGEKEILWERDTLFEWRSEVENYTYKGNFLLVLVFYQVR